MLEWCSVWRCMGINLQVTYSIRRNLCRRWKQGNGWLKGETLYGITRVSRWEKPHNIDKWLQYYSIIFRVILWISCYLKPMLQWSTCLSWLTVCQVESHILPDTLRVCHTHSLFSILVMSGDFMRLQCTCFSIFGYTYTVQTHPKIANSSLTVFIQMPFQEGEFSDACLGNLCWKKSACSL